jgi:hypothetical protein
MIALLFLIFFMNEVTENLCLTVAVGMYLYLFTVLSL